jgi:hypothetical protein
MAYPTRLGSNILDSIMALHPNEKQRHSTNQLQPDADCAKSEGGRIAG